MYRLAIILLLISIFNPVSGQERSDFIYYDSLTLKQYNDARWEELSTDAKRAIDRGYDFYYMRMRLGISLFERDKYLLAVTHFRKALEFNVDDPVATEYIYYCYLNAGKFLIANAVATEFSKSMRTSTGIDKVPVNSISLDNLFSNSMTQELVLNYDEVPGYGESGNLIIPLYFTNTGILFSKRIGDRVYFSHAYTYLRRASKLYYNDGTYYYDQFDQNLNQFQLFLSAAISNNRGLTFTPSIHYLNVRYPLLSISSTGMNTKAYSYNVTEHNFVSTLNLNKTTGLFDLGIEGAYAYMNQSNNLQVKGSLYYAPGGNSRLYLGGSFAVKYNLSGGKCDQGRVYNGVFGFSIYERVWLELSALYGDLAGYVDGSGFIIYNMVNENDYSLKTDISIPVGKSGVIIYLGSKYGSEYTCFVAEDESVSSTFKENYKSISILGGISWKF